MAVIIDYNKSVYDNIDTLKNRLRNDQLDLQNYNKEAKEIYAAVFAMRTVVNASRNQKSTLKVKMDKAAYEAQFKALMEDKCFSDFVEKSGTEKINRWMGEGHGGKVEDEFRDYLKTVPRLSGTVPTHHMPKAKERIDSLNKELETKDATSADAVRIYSEIFKTRRSVGARHGEKKLLDVAINGNAYGKTPDFEKNKTFQAFVKDRGESLKQKTLKGHGGEAELMFRDYVAGLDKIPDDVPVPYMPTARQRVEAIQKKIKSEEFKSLSKEKKQSLYIELLSARASIGAERKKPTTLDRQLDAKNASAWATYWDKSKTLKTFLESNPNLARNAALSGHGGELEDKLKEHILNVDCIEDDVPKKYMPQAKERIEVLQKKIDSGAFRALPADEKVKVYAELLSTRNSVSAIRKDKDSLETQIDPAKKKAAYDIWVNNKSFQDYVKNNPEAATKAALSGHGGALEEGYRDYIKNLDHIPAGVPTPFLPDAKTRTEILQKKIKATNDPEKRYQLYKELMATRASVEAVRGDKHSLEKKVNAGKLNEVYNQLNKSNSMKNFLVKTDDAALRDAATGGHGGALDEKYTEYAAERTYVLGTVPAGVPERFRPTPSQMMQKYREKLKAAAKGKSAAWFSSNQVKIKQKTAEMLYLAQLEKKYPTEKEKLAQMNHDTMQAGVQKIMEDPKFGNMFASMGERQALQKASANDLSPLVEAYEKAYAPPAQQPQPQPQVQPQPQQNIQDPNRQIQP